MARGSIAWAFGRLARYDGGDVARRPGTFTDGLRSGFRIVRSSLAAGAAALFLGIAGLELLIHALAVFFDYPRAFAITLWLVVAGTAALAIVGIGSQVKRAPERRRRGRDVRRRWKDPLAIPSGWTFADRTAERLMVCVAALRPFADEGEAVTDLNGTGARIRLRDRGRAEVRDDLEGFRATIHADGACSGVVIDLPEDDPQRAAWHLFRAVEAIVGDGTRRLPTEPIDVPGSSGVLGGFVAALLIGAALPVLGLVWSTRTLSAGAQDVAALIVLIPSLASLFAWTVFESTIHLHLPGPIRRRPVLGDEPREP